MKPMHKTLCFLLLSAATTTAFAQILPAPAPIFSSTTFALPSTGRLQWGGITALGELYGYVQLNGVDMWYGTSGSAVTAVPAAQATNMLRGGNIAGDLLLRSTAADGTLHMQLQSGNTLTSLDIPGQVSWTGQVNASGKVAFGATVVDSQTKVSSTNAYLYDSASGITPLGTLGGAWSSVSAINDHGVIVGNSSTASGKQHGYIYENGVMRDITPTIRDAEVKMRGINNAGEIVFNQYFPNAPWPVPYRAFKMVDGSWSGINSMSEALGIDGKGNVVGISLSGAESIINMNGNTYMLADLVDGMEGWRNLQVNGINEAGQIAASRCNDRFCEVIRLDPLSAVPEPETYGMLLGGLALLGFVSRKRRQRQA
ncbi:PEP-CTERM sorting domain-containing protein [Janthinobacterium sp. SUN211]|nr:PEP-CTERM sorting domain-containing protein [Janthinobacterium sp. SUN211]